MESSSILNTASKFVNVKLIREAQKQHYDAYIELEKFLEKEDENVNKVCRKVLDDIYGTDAPSNTNTIVFENILKGIPVHETIFRMVDGLIFLKMIVENDIVLGGKKRRTRKTKKGGDDRSLDAQQPANFWQAQRPLTRLDSPPRPTELPPPRTAAQVVPPGWQPPVWRPDQEPTTAPESNPIQPGGKKKAPAKRKPKTT